MRLKIASLPRNLNAGRRSGRQCFKTLRIMRERASGQNFELLYREVSCAPLLFVPLASSFFFFAAHRVIPLEDVTIYIHEDYF